MSARMDDYSDFFESTAPPEKFEEKKKELEAFIRFHQDSQTPIVLVTSGGTTVPLESRTVRYIDNFSMGTRGSASAENFLSQGYAVLFLHRLRSLEPFHRHVQASVLDHLVVTATRDQKTITVESSTASRLLSILQQYQEVKGNNRLLMVSFTSLGDYLHLLREACRLLRPLGSRVMLYLAAAVSDFYIPADEMPEHKIQSSNGPLNLSLHMVPKMLKPLVKDWMPQAFVVSFKLETDKDLLLSKSRGALQQYQHKVVVGNLLDSRKTEVVLVTPHSADAIRLTADDAAQGKEIERPLTQALVKLHRDSITTH